MANPLEFFDLFGARHIEPSITGLIELETEEAVNPTPVNDLVIVGPFRGGQPLSLRRFRNLSALRAVHDPDGVGDVGAALAAMARAPFGDPDVFGAQNIATVRTDQATQAAWEIVAGAVKLVALRTADFGVQANQASGKLVVNTDQSITLTLSLPRKTFVSPNLGLALKVEYTGSAPGTKTVLVSPQRGRVTYGTNPSDGNTLVLNGVTFEFDNDSTVGSGAVAVPIGTTVNDTMANLADAINAQGLGVVASSNANTVSLVGAEVGVELSATGGSPTIVRFGKAARLKLSINTSVVADFALSQPQYSTVGSLVQAIGAVAGFKATLLSNEARFLDSERLDFTATPLTIGGGGATLTAYVGSIIAWVMSGTQRQFTVDLGADVGEYDATNKNDATYGFQPSNNQAASFSGGTTAAASLSRWQDALDLVAEEYDSGAILLINSENIDVIMLVAAFVEEQRTLGRWFRAYCGLPPGQSLSDYERIAAQVDSTRVRLTCQRLGVLKDAGIEYLSPVFGAAVLAGGVAGNLPWVKPLTERRVRVVGLHPADNFTLVDRESLLAAGITMFRQDADAVRVALHVTSSRDPVRRMPRIASEVDTVDQIDAAMRAAFAPMRGSWAGANVGARVISIGTRVLQSFVDQGAIVGGLDADGRRVPSWQWLDPAFSISAGVLRIDYMIRLGGEIDHISQHGRANYSRIVSEGGRQQAMSTTIGLQ